MNLPWGRLEQIIQAKVRMANDSLARPRRPGESLASFIVREAETKARRDTALALLNDLRQAEAQAALGAAQEGREPKTVDEARGGLCDAYDTSVTPRRCEKEATARGRTAEGEWAKACGEHSKQLFGE